MTMLRIGPTFCAMPPWTRTRLLARASWNGVGADGCRRGRRASRRRVDQAMGGQQAAPADAPLGVALAGGHAVDQLDAGEDAARILPAAAGAAQPLAEDRPGHDHPRLLEVERAGQVPRLAGRPHQQR